MSLLKEVNTVESNQEREGGHMKGFLRKVLVKGSVRKEAGIWHLGGDDTGQVVVPFLYPVPSSHTLVRLSVSPQGKTDLMDFIHLSLNSLEAMIFPSSCFKLAHVIYNALFLN